jgi:tetratricopeptide (TPR) repeat protein
MVERHPRDAAASFCTQCGIPLPRDARFCPSCGRAVTSLVVDDVEPAPHAPHDAERPRPVASRRASHAPAHGAAVATRGWRDQVPGLAVLGVFLAVGLGVWVTILRPSARTSTAPSRQAPPPETAGALPPGHPPMTLPDEAKKFIAGLVEKANAAPKDVTTWKNLAQVQSRASEMDPTYGAAAIESYKHVLGVAPDDEEALRGLANLYYDSQQFGAAAEQYERYLRVHPDDPSARTDLATTYLYQRQFDRAVATYQDVIKAHPDFVQAHFNLGLAYEAMGKHDDALATLEVARGLATDEQTRSQIARVAAELKNPTRPRGGAGAGGAAGAAGAGPMAPGGMPAGAMPQGAAPGDVAGSMPSAGGAMGQGAGPMGATSNDAAAAAAIANATDFKSGVEGALHAHPIIGPKISAIEWPTATTARVKLAGFPLDQMPEFARNLFRARLETILDDAKTKFGTTAETAIDLVDADKGTTMEHITH